MKGKPLIQSFSHFDSRWFAGRSPVIAKQYITVRNMLFGHVEDVDTNVFFINCMSDSKNVDFFHASRFYPILLLYLKPLFMLAKCFTR